MGRLMILLAVCGVEPYLIGMCFTRFLKKDENRISVNLVLGYILLWAFLQVILIPAIYLRVSFHVVAYVTGIVMGVVSVVSAVFNYRRLWQMIKTFPKRFSTKKIFLYLAMVLIAGQAFYVSRAAVGDDDDAFYVAMASTAVETDTLMEVDPYTGELYNVLPSRYVLSPFPIYVALMSRMVGVRAVTMAHTLLPPCLILLAYCVYYMLANQLFGDNEEKKGIFMLLTVAVLTFSGYSVYTQGVFMMTRIWQGKAVLVALLIPLIFYWGLRLYMQGLSKAEWAAWFATMLACCFVSSMGIMLAAIMTGIIGICAAVFKKNWKNLLWTVICCIPNIIFAMIYILIR